LLNALGRKPATQGLDLSKAGISTSKNGQIICNEYQQTTNPKVYASGDVTGPHEIVHVAILQGEAAAKHATGQVAYPVNYDSLVSVVFTDPQVAQVGLSKQQLDARGAEYLSADYPFDDHGKSMLMNAKYGYVQVYCDLFGRILGAVCVGKDAGELIHSMAVAVSLKANIHDLLKVHWYHPTLSEIWTYPLEDLANAL
ncbi:MAG: FAD-dependent oxidoreductase, partial [Verrucomicrobiota bacterium]|nr:FAD-dependent oxidoreductase [Verrucomicrobiota bacterium]